MKLTVRVTEGEWVEAGNVKAKKGDSVQYRAELYAYHNLRTPRIEKISIELTEA